MGVHEFRISPDPPLGVSNIAGTRMVTTIHVVRHRQPN